MKAKSCYRHFLGKDSQVANNITDYQTYTPSLPGHFPWKTAGCRHYLVLQVPGGKMHAKGTRSWVEGPANAIRFCSLVKPSLSNNILIRSGHQMPVFFFYPLGKLESLKESYLCRLQQEARDDDVPLANGRWIKAAAPMLFFPRIDGWLVRHLADAEVRFQNHFLNPKKITNFLCACK